MKSLKKQRRIQIILVTAVALALSTALIGYAMRDGINFFRAPSQVIAEPPAPGEVFRNGVFEATEILAKHDETYMPKEVVDALKAQGVYKDPEG